jgi:hypothetical protein
MYHKFKLNFVLAAMFYPSLGGHISDCGISQIWEYIVGNWGMWVSDCCLMHNEQFFSYIFVQFTFNEMMMMSTLY